jgi:hypothetical protein
MPTAQCPEPFLPLTAADQPPQVKRPEPPEQPVDDPPLLLVKEFTAATCFSVSVDAHFGHSGFWPAADIDTIFSNCSPHSWH